MSIKALEIAEEQEAVAQYGSADSGASLGDILGAALAQGGDEEPAEAPAAVEEAAAPTPASASSGDTSQMDDKGRLSEPQGDADDLKKISGVGPAFEKRLNSAGIFHFWQVAALSSEQVESLEEELSMQGRMERDEWVKQAKELMG